MHSPVINPPNTEDPAFPRAGRFARGGRSTTDPETGPEGCGGDSRDVQWIPDLVATIDSCPAQVTTETGLAVLVEADERVDAEDHAAGPGGQPVQAIGELDRLRPGRGDQNSEDDEPGDSQADER